MRFVYESNENTPRHGGQDINKNRQKREEEEKKTISHGFFNGINPSKLQER